MAAAEIIYPAIARYVQRGIAGRRCIRIEKPAHIAIALHRLAGLDTPYGHDHLEILTDTADPGDRRVQARLYADDLEAYLH